MIVVCTTAGDVFKIRDGTETGHSHVSGEIWSDPAFVSEDNTALRIAFGARDSKLHVMEL